MQSIYLLLFLEERNGHNFLKIVPICNPFALSEFSQCSLFIYVNSYDMSSDNKVPIWHKLIQITLDSYDIRIKKWI